jgi:hypothetical protein
MCTCSAIGKQQFNIDSSWRRNKAVADGAVSYYLDHFVSARVSRMVYGTDVNWRYNSCDPEHLLRSSKKILFLGHEILPDGFDAILLKVYLLV